MGYAGQHKCDRNTIIIIFILSIKNSILTIEKSVLPFTKMALKANKKGLQKGNEHTNQFKKTNITHSPRIYTKAT